jgi:hypothetical protein
MMHHRAESAKPADARWHRRRQQARTNSFSVDEWGDIETTKWDLDTAGIKGGKYNPRTYTIDRDLNAEYEIENGTDVRTLNDR